MVKMRTCAARAAAAAADAVVVLPVSRPSESRMTEPDAIFASRSSATDLSTPS